MLAGRLERARSVLSRIDSRNSFAQGVVWTFLASIAASCLSIGSSAVIARWLGPAGKGALALAVLVPGMLALLLSGGIGVANVYFAGSGRLDVRALTRNSVGYAIVATAVGVSIVAVVTGAGWLELLVPGLRVPFVLLAILGLPVLLLSGSLAGILQGLQRILTVNVLNLTAGAIALGLTILLVIVLRMTLIGALVAWLGGAAAGCATMGLVVARQGGSFRPNWDSSVMRSTVSFGMRSQIGNVLQFFNYRLDVLFVNYFVGAAGVGIYSVSVGVAEMLWHLPNAVGFVIFPKAAATRAEVMNAFTPRVFRITLGLTALGAAGLAVLGRPLIGLVYSGRFAAAYGPMVALLPGAALMGAAKALTNEIAGRGYPHLNSINAGLGLVLTIALDLALIPRHGLLGAAVASSVAYTTIFFTAVAFYLRVSRAP